MMLDPAKFALFVGVSWALILAPGPDMLYVITRAVSHGRRAGVVSAIGVVCGILVHTTAAVFGMTLIFQTSALAFLIVKYLGAIYLIYLGVNGWRNKSAFDLRPSPAGKSFRSLFWQGVLSNVLNPKIAIFFLAFLPQFVDKGSGQVMLQMGFLSLTFALFGLSFLTVVGYSAGAIGGWLTQRPFLARFLQRLAAGILIGLGVRLALERQ
jgi:threonine/homoserine/homoserine lactone efflux protein